MAQTLSEKLVSELSARDQLLLKRALQSMQRAARQLTDAGSYLYAMDEHPTWQEIIEQEIEQSKAALPSFSVRSRMMQGLIAAQAVRGSKS